MIVDCHTHINCPSSEIDTTEHFDACGKVDAGIVLAVGRDNGLEASRELGEYVNRHPKLVGFASLNPHRDPVGVDDVKAVTVDLGLKGIVLYCAGGKFHPADSQAIRLYESAAQLKLPLFFHNVSTHNSDSVLQYAQPLLLDEIAGRFPALKMVIGSMGLPFLDQTICMLGKHENVYADLSISPQKKWEVYNIVVSAHEADVMDKLLFGSGYPIAKPDNCIETLLGFNMMLGDTNLPGVPREEIRGVIERDTLALLGITLP
jgi:hypothetical protein